MKINNVAKTLMAAMAVMAGAVASAQTPPPTAAPGGFPPPRQAYVIKTPTYLSNYFYQNESPSVTPDKKGFIQRWLILEPISKPNRSNTVFTDSYLNQVFDTIYFKGQFDALPKDGQKVKVGKQTLRWHALDSRHYNAKLYRFCAAKKIPVYGVLFYVTTVIDCPADIENVRLAAGSNSASKWWLNGEEVLLLSGDRRMVVDDGMSPRLTLKKGKNILRGAVINGPGMSDFCVRFVDEAGNPVYNYTISYQ